MTPPDPPVPGPAVGERRCPLVVDQPSWQRTEPRAGGAKPRLAANARDPSGRPSGGNGREASGQSQIGWKSIRRVGDGRRPDLIASKQSPIRASRHQTRVSVMARFRDKVQLAQLTQMGPSSRCRYRKPQSRPNVDSRLGNFSRSGEKNTTWSRPALFAAYIAKSALNINE